MCTIHGGWSKGRDRNPIVRSKINGGRSPEWTQEAKPEEWNLRLCQQGFYRIFAIEFIKIPEGGEAVYVIKFERDPDVPVGGEPGWRSKLSLRIARLSQKSVFFSAAI